MHDVIPFLFENHAVRVVTDENGDPWFVAKDVSAVLDYSDAEAMTRRLDDDEKQNLQIVGFGPRGVTIINESGLYSAILGSSKPEAKPFKRWVTHDVLPAIRRTGRYALDVDDAPDVPVSVTHRADHVVSAARCFSSFMRVSGALKLGHARAALAANQAAVRSTGIDVLDEMGVSLDELKTVDAAPAGSPDDLAQRVLAWIAEPEQAARKEFSLAELLVGVQEIAPGEPPSVALATRLGMVMRRLGFRRVEHRNGPQRRLYVRPATSMFG